MKGGRLVVGTRGSSLAREQTRRVVERLGRVHAGLAVDVRVIRTEGDRHPAAPLSTLGGRGVFVIELEEALLSGEVDTAVHSLKDLPAALRPGLALGAVPERVDPRDALVSRDSQRLDALPVGAVVGTGSPRRAAQLLALRPDLTIREIRGNVETRLQKVLEGTYDATVLAVAGLERLGLRDRIAEVLEPPHFLPAPGQGALAVEARGDDGTTLALLRAIDDAGRHAEARAERALESALEAGCQVPVAALATARSGRVSLEAAVWSSDGSTCMRENETAMIEEAEALGRRVGERLLARAGHLVR
ncbi:MAG: hydroxymethylbilane synthase [Chloroflexi bacterium]|nr:hydroxymethylbilane synthase [Chloroflexota bacterium]